MISAGPGRTSVGGETSVPLEYVLVGTDDMHESHDAPRFHHDDQLRQQPLLVATSATMLKISSLFMAFLIGSTGLFPHQKWFGDEQLYITVDEVQLRSTTISNTLLRSCIMPCFVW